MSTNLLQKSTNLHCNLDNTKTKMNIIFATDDEACTAFCEMCKRSNLLNILFRDKGFKKVMNFFCD